MSPNTETARPRGRPPKIDRDRVLETALALGFDALSMREVATQLGVTDAALYRLFDNRDALALAMAERISLAFELPDPQPEWRAWLKALALAMRRHLLTYPGSAAVFSRTGPANPGTLRIVEAVVSVLMDHGFDAQAAGRSYSLLSSYLIATVVRQEAVAAHSPAMAAGFAALVDETRPGNAALAKVADTWLSTSWDRDYEFGIERLIDGLAAFQEQGASR